MNNGAIGNKNIKLKIAFISLLFCLLGGVIHVKSKIFEARNAHQEFELSDEHDGWIPLGQDEQESSSTSIEVRRGESVVGSEIEHEVDTGIQIVKTKHHDHVMNGHATKYSKSHVTLQVQDPECEQIFTRDAELVTHPHARA